MAGNCRSMVEIMPMTGLYIHRMDFGEQGGQPGLFITVQAGQRAGVRKIITYSYLARNFEMIPRPLAWYAWESSRYANIADAVRRVLIEALRLAFPLSLGPESPELAGSLSELIARWGAERLEQYALLESLTE